MKKLLLFLLVIITTSVSAQTRPHWLQLQGKPFVDTREYGAKGDGITDDTEKLQLAINAVPAGGCLFVAPGRYIISDQLNITKAITILGNNAEFVNATVGWAAETAGAIVNITGTVSSQGTLAADAADGDLTITVSNPTSWAVGDIISLSNAFTCTYHSIIVSIDVESATLTLDRRLPDAFASGSVLWKGSHLRNVLIQDLVFDHAWKYGYSITASCLRDSTITNIKSKNFGSKSVQLVRSFDCLISDITATKAFTQAPGLGYATRITLSNDCLIRGVIGREVRHTVDLSAACRNVVESCSAYSNDNNAFGTHSNRCRYNIFRNLIIDSCGIGLAANPAGGDVQNIFENIVMNESGTIMYNHQLNPDTNRDANILRNITASKVFHYAIGEFNLYIDGLMLRHRIINSIIRPGGATEIVIKNSILSTDKPTLGIVTNSSPNTTLSLTLQNTKIEATSASVTSLIEAVAGVNLTLENCDIKLIGTLGTSNGAPVFIASGTHKIKGCTFDMPTGHAGFAIGIAASSTTTIQDTTFKNCGAGPVRTVSGNLNLILENVISTNCGAWSFVGKTVSSLTPTPLSLGNVVAPGAGTWAAGTRVLNAASTLTIGDPVGWVCTVAGSPGTWKGFGEIMP